MNDLVAALVRLRAWQLAVRTTIVGSALLALFGAAQAATTRTPTIAVAAVAGAALLTAVFPDTHAGSAALVVFGWIWVVHVGATTSAWLLLAAPAIALFHVTTAFVACTPGHATVDRAIAVRWGRRFTLIAAGTAAVWGVVAGLDRLTIDPAIALTTAALIVLCAAALVFIRSTVGR